MIKRILKIFKTKAGQDNRKEKLIKEISREVNIINPKGVAEQFLSGKTVINYVYKGHSLYINNEGATLYHLVNSTSKMEKLVDSIDLDECNIVFDIGANTGLFTFFLKKKYPNAKVFIFEPDERLFSVIKRNINGLSNCHLIPLAISDKDNGEIDFYINPNSAQTNSTIKEAVTILEKEEVILLKKVKTKTIDGFCLENEITNVDVLKIDIQGGELGALHKASDILKRTEILLAEVSFFVYDTVDLLKFISTFFKKYKAINGVFMGADLKFYRKEKP